MVQVRKAEQHARQRLADERAQLQADFDRQRSVWQQQVSELDRYKALMTNARQDPLALLAAAGFGDADYEPLAQLAYSMSPEGAKDPRIAQGRKIAAHESLARRAQQTEQERMRSEIQALRDEQAKRDATAVAEQNVQRYLQTVARAVGEQSPHVRYAMTRAPEATQQYLLAVADRLYTDSGPSHELRDVPTPDQVIRAYERERAGHIRDVLAELEALGVDPRSFGKASPAAAQVAAPPAVAPAQPAAAPRAPAAVPAAAPPVSTPTPAQPQNDDDRRRLALEELRKLRFAG